MKVGILSDTHDHFANMVYVLELFKQEEVGKILHAGDIASPTGAMALDSIAKRLGIQADIVAVFGNNDGDAWRFANFKSFPSHGIDVSIDYHLEAAQGEVADKSFVLYHGANPILTQALLDAGSHDLVVTGHDHRAQMRYHNIRGREVLHVNPGTVAGTYLHCVTRPSCAIYDTKEHAAKFIHFDFQTPKKKYFIDI